MAETLEEHYRRLLGLEEPWVVEDVDLDLAGQRVEIRLRTRSGLKMPLSGVRGPIRSLRSWAGTALAAFGHHAV